MSLNSSSCLMWSRGLLVEAFPGGFLLNTSYPFVLVITRRAYLRTQFIGFKHLFGNCSSEEA